MAKPNGSGGWSPTWVKGHRWHERKARAERKAVGYPEVSMRATASGSTHDPNMYGKPSPSLDYNSPVHKRAQKSGTYTSPKPYKRSPQQQ